MKHHRIRDSNSTDERKEDVNKLGSLAIANSPDFVLEVYFVFRMCVSARQNFGGRTEWVDAPANFLVLAGCCGDDRRRRRPTAEEDGRGREEHHRP